MPVRRDARFTQAACAYLAYGALYEGFAALRVWQGRLPPGIPGSRAAAYLVVGAAFMLAIPLFVYRGHRRFTQLVAILVGLRAVALVGILAGLEVPLSYGREPFFLRQMSSDAVYAVALAITLLTLGFLARAGWQLGASQPKPAP